jgi:deoxyribose-phosphate aldolase
MNQFSGPGKIPETAPGAATEAATERLKLLASIVAQIDHTILKQDAIEKDVAQICHEALRAKELLGVGPTSVCVNSSDVAFCVERLQGSGILVCSVVGFPLGRNVTEAKVFETEAAIRAGAQEIDMVINVGSLLSGNPQLVANEIRLIAETCQAGNAKLKVIIEACKLTDQQKIDACRLAAENGADFVKTSTGTQEGGATLEDVALMKKTVAPYSRVLVKAAGGISTVKDALAMREAGASRFGSSALLKAILKEISNDTDNLARATDGY